MNLKIDHLVYAVLDLDSAINDFEKLLGVRPVFGGYHKTQGTKNALVNLDDGSYLELIATDDTNTEIPPPRWMGVDVLTTSQITRWALKSDNLISHSTILRAHQPEMGVLKGGSRNTEEGAFLKWKLSMPLAKPEVEIVPFLIDWSFSDIHPHDSLPQTTCKLVALYATHPQPEAIEKTLIKLGVDLTIKKSAIISIKAKIETSKGSIII